MKIHLTMSDQPRLLGAFGSAQCGTSRNEKMIILSDSIFNTFCNNQKNMEYFNMYKKFTKMRNAATVSLCRKCKESKQGLNMTELIQIDILLLGASQATRELVFDIGVLIILGAVGKLENSMPKGNYSGTPPVRSMKRAVAGAFADRLMSMAVLQNGHSFLEATNIQFTNGEQ